MAECCFIFLSACRWYQTAHHFRKPGLMLYDLAWLYSSSQIFLTKVWKLSNIKGNCPTISLGRSTLYRIPVNFTTMIHIAIWTLVWPLGNARCFEAQSLSCFPYALPLWSLCIYLILFYKYVVYVNFNKMYFEENETCQDTMESDLRKSLVLPKCSEALTPDVVILAWGLTALSCKITIKPLSCSQSHVKPFWSQENFCLSHCSTHDPIVWDVSNPLQIPIFMTLKRPIWQASPLTYQAVHSAATRLLVGLSYVGL